MLGAVSGQRSLHCRSSVRSYWRNVCVNPAIVCSTDIRTNEYSLEPLLAHGHEHDLIHPYRSESVYPHGQPGVVVRRVGDQPEGI